MRTEHPRHSLPSDDDNEVQNLERRAAPRSRAIMRVGRVITDHDEGFAQARNISDQGAQLQIPVMLGETITLEVAENVMLTGQIVWSDGLNFGLKFDRYAYYGELLTKLADKFQQYIDRPARPALAKAAITRGGNGTRMVQTLEFSQRGMKLKHYGAFFEGLCVKVTLPLGLERQGVVRWSKDNFAGLMLLGHSARTSLGPL